MARGGAASADGDNHDHPDGKQASGSQVPPRHCGTQACQTDTGQERREQREATGTASGCDCGKTDGAKGGGRGVLVSLFQFHDISPVSAG
jgi:hypothetical protein